MQAQPLSTTASNNPPFAVPGDPAPTHQPAPSNARFTAKEGSC
jgi:hypothetical protein